MRISTALWPTSPSAAATSAAIWSQFSGIAVDLHEVRAGHLKRAEHGVSALNAIDKSCAVVRQMMRERVQICAMFGPQSGECASATYHTSATHATITENKRLSEVLSWVMAQQEAGAPKVGPVGKQRTRYTPTGKPRRGNKGWVERRSERRAAEAAQSKPLPPAE